MIEHVQSLLQPPAAAKKQIIDLLGPGGYLDRPEDLSLYEYDGKADKARPEMVVVPARHGKPAAIVRISKEHGVFITGRGAGTGLSGGAIPRQGGVLDRFRSHESHSRSISRMSGRCCSQEW